MQQLTVARERKSSTRHTSGDIRSRTRAILRISFPRNIFRWIAVLSVASGFVIGGIRASVLAAPDDHSQADAPEQRYERGKELLAEGRYREASEAFHQAQLASVPDSQTPTPVGSSAEAPPPAPAETLTVSDPFARTRLSQWHVRQGRISLDKDEYLQATIHAERALELDPESAEARQLLQEARQQPPDTSSASSETAAGEASSSEISAAAVHEYLVTTGDILEIRVWHDAKPLASAETVPAADQEKEYRVSAGDVLEVFIWQQPDLSRDVIVRPDGRLSFPLIGDVNVAGMTLIQLDDTMTGKLKIYLRNPDVSLAVKRFSSSGASGGPKTSSFGEEAQQLSRDVKVRPDGRLSFPLVGEIKAEGMTLAQLNALLTERLKPYLRNPDVSLALKQFGGTKTIVLGEIGAPGVYAPTGEGRVLEVIALAGGFTKNANRRSVMLMRGGLAAPEVVKLNLDRLLEQGKFEDNMALQPNDILYVPKTAIASTLQFMEQFYPTIAEILVGQGVAHGFGYTTELTHTFRKIQGKTGG